MTDTPIADYALLSDRHGAALVALDGSVDWLCLPRFDSPALMAGLLDERAGSWSIRPVAEFSSHRRYLPETMVLETTFVTDAGTVTVTDALSLGADDDPHQLGARAPHVLLRSVSCLDGEVEVAVDFRVRPEYGLVTPLLRQVDGGVIARGGPTVCALSTPFPLSIASGTATGTVSLSSGQGLAFSLHASALADSGSQLFTPAEVGEQLDVTISAWRSWSRLHQHYEGPWREQVHLSGRVLQALSYQPTGAIIAAATTSLPEQIGGERNWDYRYTWIRDAAFTMDALWVAACPDEAGQFFSFMTSAAATAQPESHLQIMYGIGGEHDLPERELPHLDGWRASRPVRVGNEAATQVQLDVYGELLATALRFADQLDSGDPLVTDFLISVADTAARVWREPDQGIWEIRGEPRHFLYSKLMCWVALDRAVDLAAALGATDRVPHWATQRDEIREQILTHGFSEAAGAFTQSFGSDDLDASALMMPIVGFLPGDDPRVLATIDAVAEHLSDPAGLVYRYRTTTGVDGLEGEEGTFLLCTFWLAQAYALAGRTDQATEVFDRAISYANDVGLLAEQVDTATGALLGNFPQAFSHIGLVNAANAISEAQTRVSAVRP